MIAKTILIVEDESIVAKDLQRRLKKLGYFVPAIASSGEEAIDIAAEIYPDLVLMDIRLKGDIDGVEAAKQIQTRGDIPIIYLTAYADDSTLERARLTEPFGYILKPFKEKELQTTIEIAITKNKRERKLKENHKILDIAIKSIGDGVIACDVQGLVTFMNPVAEKLTGWKQEEAGGKNSSEIFKIISKDGNSLENTIEKTLPKDIIAYLPKETMLISQNGIQTPIEEYKSSIKDDRGNIIGEILVFRDVTERKLATEAFQKQIEQEELVTKLAQINQVKDEFLSTVSHELRSPLSNIKMAIHVLQTTNIAENCQQYLNILKAECDREIELLNDLLDLQRAEVAASSLFNPEPLILQFWLPNIVDAFSIRIQERQQNIQLNIPSDTPPLISDNINLTRIFAELLNNACKYTAIGGEIVLNVSHSGSREWGDGEMGGVGVETRSVCTGGVNFSVSPEVRKGGGTPARNNSWRVNVCASPCPLVPASSLWLPTPCTIITISNSTEIPAAALPRIFEKFYRVRSAEFSKQPGTGLGLALVQRLVEQLQGTIEVESSGGWTTFTLQLADLVVTETPSL